MKRVILDTDVGTDVDDALAIALAAASPELHLEGLTTVHADAPLRARIARALLALAGRAEVPVIAGASRPLSPAFPEVFHWHPTLWGHEGRGLLSGDDLLPTAAVNAAASGDAAAPTEDAAARFIVERAWAEPGTLSLIAIGPLTNVARALQLEPRLADWLLDITLMGGMVEADGVPWPPVLETNLNADPRAAEVVFGSGVPLTIVPFEVTTRVFLTPAQRALMRSWRAPLASALVALMEQMLHGFADFSATMSLPADIFEGDPSYMHDPVAVYAAMATQHVRLRRRHVALEVRDRVLRTTAYPDRQPNMQVCEAVDAPAFVAFWLERVASLAADGGEHQRTARSRAG